MRSWALLLPVILLAAACGPSEEEPALVDDIVAAAPDNAKKILDNGFVTVTQFVLPPGGKLPPHVAPARIVYPLSDFKLRYQAPGSQAGVVRDFRKDQPLWIGTETYAIGNIGPITARWLEVAARVPNPDPYSTSDLLEKAPGMAQRLFENENAKVILVTLEPTEALPRHNGAGRVVYALTPAKLKLTMGDQTVEEEWAEGEARWYDPGEHAVENISDHEVKFVMIEIR